MGSDNAGGISPVLRMVSDLPCISNKECNDFYGIVGDGIVYIDTTGGKGSCNGDSGGPLVTKAGMKAQDRHGTRSELSPSVPQPVVRLDTPLDSPGLSTTWTGSSLRLGCNWVLIKCSIICMTLY